MVESPTKKSRKVWILYVLIVLGGLGVIAWDTIDCQVDDLTEEEIFEIRDYGSTWASAGFEGYVEVAVKQPLAELTITLDFVNNDGDVLGSQTASLRHLRADETYRLTYDSVFFLGIHNTVVSNTEYRLSWRQCFIR